MLIVAFIYLFNGINYCVANALLSTVSVTIIDLMKGLLYPSSGCCFEKGIYDYTQRKNGTTVLVIMAIGLTIILNPTPTDVVSRRAEWQPTTRACIKVHAASLYIRYEVRTRTTKCKAQAGSSAIMNFPFFHKRAKER